MALLPPGATACFMSLAKRQAQSERAETVRPVRAAAPEGQPVVGTACPKGIGHRLRLIHRAISVYASRLALIPDLYSTSIKSYANYHKLLNCGLWAPKSAWSNVQSSLFNIKILPYGLSFKTKATEGGAEIVETVKAQTPKEKINWLSWCCGFYEMTVNWAGGHCPPYGGLVDKVKLLHAQGAAHAGAAAGKLTHRRVALGMNNPLYLLPEVPGRH
jgi:hypothetical protein